MDIRELQATDLGALRDLLRQLGYEVCASVLAERLRSIAGRDDHRAMVAEQDNGIVGFIHVYERSSLERGMEAVVQALAVDAGARRQGIGDTLLNAAQAWAAARGLGTISLHTRADRADAHAFYARSGFQKAASASLMRKKIDGT